MKILAFVDMHGSEKEYREVEKKLKGHPVDVLVCAGDLTIFESNIGTWIKKLDKLGKLMFVVHGNHENRVRLQKLCEGSKNLMFMHKKHLVMDGVLFIGYGGQGFRAIDEEFESYEKELEKLIKAKREQNKQLKIVMIAHQPPANSRPAMIYEEDAGNKSFYRFVKKHKLDLVVCGHLHENSGKESNIGNTRVINPGPMGKILEV